MDALILHGEDGRSVDLAKIKKSSGAELAELLRLLYPTMKERILSDLLPLVQGNIAHINEVRDSNRTVEESEHNEWVLGVGRGFDWLHEINTAFIVGPFDPNLAVAIKTAATLLKSNIDEGRIDPSGVVLSSSAVYRDAVGPEYQLAKEKTLFLNRFALSVIKEHVPDLALRLQVLSGITNLNTLKYEVIERSVANAV